MSSICYFKALIIYFARHYDYITCYIPHASKEKKQCIYIYIIIKVYIYVCMQNARIYIHVYTIKKHIFNLIINFYIIITIK